MNRVAVFLQEVRNTRSISRCCRRVVYFLGQQERLKANHTHRPAVQSEKERNKMSEDKAQQQDRISEWVKYWNDGTMFELHAKTPHQKIIKYYEKIINGKSKATLFFPLCGDVVDMILFADKGHDVVGVECSELGVKSFFTQNNIEYKTEPCDKVKGTLFKSKDGQYKIYCCDLFDFDVSVAGQFDAIIDFGSMGAIYKKDLQQYADLMKSLMKSDCVHFLECFLYDLEKFPDSLPSCFTVEKLLEFYGDRCSVEKLEEGPNPYEETEAKVFEKEKDSAADSANTADSETSKTECTEHRIDEENMPDITGAAYFIIRPK